MSLTPFLHFSAFFYKLRYDFRTIKGCHKIEAIRMRPQAFRNFKAISMPVRWASSRLISGENRLT